MDKQLAKIEKCEFGKGGYQEAEFGLSFTFSGKGWGVGAFWSGGWGGKRSEYCKWTEDDRKKSMADLCLKIDALLDEAKVQNVSQLKGLPVEVTLERNIFHSFRILTEVL